MKSSNLTKELLKHLEEFAAAYLKKTKLMPDEVKLIQHQHYSGGVWRIESWFEPLEFDEELRKLAKTHPADVSAIGITRLVKHIEEVEARAEAAEARVAELEAAQKEVDHVLLHYLSRYPDLPILTYETQVEALCALMESVGLPGIAKPQPPKPEEVEK